MLNFQKLNRYYSVEINDQFLFTKFIGVAMVNSIRQVSSEHYCDTWLTSLIGCPPLIAESSSATIYLAPCTLFLCPTSFALVTTILLSVCVSEFWFYIPHRSEIIWFLAFPDWLTSLSIKFARSIHVVAFIEKSKRREYN